MRQISIQLNPKNRGFHIITEEIVRQLPQLPDVGLLHLFIQHTSAGICLNENADPTVLSDMNEWFDRNIKEDEPYYRHTYEGPDDMPAHIKSVLSGHDLHIPISKGRLNLGTWQGIYLGEFRNHAGSRRIIATIIE
ncbi:MAG: secondary thiamine-phosphate synthase enzyme YjbQ [Flavobacteriales bacterium]|nr:secondary thiamine-phosphate synthase enzyme YjbQ [Flavobacteriales bacterium]